MEKKKKNAQGSNFYQKSSRRRERGETRSSRGSKGGVTIHPELASITKFWKLGVIRKASEGGGGPWRAPRF